MGIRSRWEFWAREKNKKNRQSEDWPLHKLWKRRPPQKAAATFIGEKQFRGGAHAVKAAASRRTPKWLTVIAAVVAWLKRLRKNTEKLFSTG